MGLNKMLLLSKYFSRQGVPITGYDRALELNATPLLLAVDALIAVYNANTGLSYCPVITSGFRTTEINADIVGAAPNSLHMKALAVDLDDQDGKFDAWLITDIGQATLKKVGLWMEHPSKTLRWCHLQSVPQPSYKKTGRHWFYP
jgi:Peptidase M15